VRTEKVDDPDIAEMEIYKYFWKEYGLNMEQVQKMDPKLVDKLLVYADARAELEQSKIEKAARGGR